MLGAVPRGGQSRASGGSPGIVSSSAPRINASEHVEAICGLPLHSADMSADPPYLSAREAADYCGVSEKTVRNWISSGRLFAERSAASFRISREQLDPFRRSSAPQSTGAERKSAESAPEVCTRPADSADTVPVADVLELVREAQADALAKAEAAAMWQARAELLAGELADARKQLLALQAPQPEPAPQQPAVAVEPAEEPSRAPWWRRLLFG